MSKHCSECGRPTFDMGTRLSKKDGKEFLTFINKWKKGHDKRQKEREKQKDNE